MSYDLSFEFDELYRLVKALGFNGQDLDIMMAFIIHSVNKVLRSEVYGRSEM